MEKIEKLYFAATQLRLNFDYHQSDTGAVSVLVTDSKSGLMLDYSVLEDGYTWITVAGKRYEDFDAAVNDYLDLLALKKG